MHWGKVSLLYLFIVAVIGTALRAATYIPLSFNYGNLVHAHSHVAFQGWVYTSMFLLLTRLFLKEHQIRKGRYLLQFKLTILVILGILISFSLQGYGLYSILFSTLFQLLNYWFIYRFFMDTRTHEQDRMTTLSLRFIKTGLMLGILSTFVPIGIGVLSARGLNGTEIYQSFVYTFLHLQYNGWFLFIALGLFFKFLENSEIGYKQKSAVNFYRTFTSAVIPAIALSLLGMSFSNFIKPLAYFAAVIQGLSLVFLWMSISNKLKVMLSEKSIWFKSFFSAFLLFFFFKVLLQCLSIYQPLQPYAFHNKLIILAYLHMSLIGVLSFLLLALMIHLKWLSLDGFTKTGSVLLITGFALTELVLVLGGLELIYDHITLSVGSAIMALGILLLIFSRKSQFRLF